MAIRMQNPRAGLFANGFHGEDLFSIWLSLAADETNQSHIRRYCMASPALQSPQLLRMKMNEWLKRHPGFPWESRMSKSSLSKLRSLTAVVRQPKEHWNLIEIHQHAATLFNACVGNSLERFGIYLIVPVRFLSHRPSNSDFTIYAENFLRRSLELAWSTVCAEEVRVETA